MTLKTATFTASPPTPSIKEKAENTLDDIYMEIGDLHMEMFVAPTEKIEDNVLNIGTGGGQNQVVFLIYTTHHKENKLSSYFLSEQYILIRASDLQVVFTDHKQSKTLAVNKQSLTGFIIKSFLVNAESDNWVALPDFTFKHFHFVEKVYLNGKKKNPEKLNQFLKTKSQSHTTKKD